MRGPRTKSSWSAIPLENPSSELKVSSLHNNVIDQLINRNSVVKDPLASLKDKKIFTLMRVHSYNHIVCGVGTRNLTVYRYMLILK